MDQRLFFPATERNREPIGDLLERMLPARGVVLELASGSGEHAVAFQQRFPGLRWQASDPNPDHRASINSWIRHAGLDHVMPHALELDVEQRPWSLPSHVTDDLKTMVCINLLHISPPTCTEALLMEACERLPEDGLLIIYGPFCRNGRQTSASNAAFDVSLRQRNPLWGLRDLQWIDSLLGPLPMDTIGCHEMPANNNTLVLKRS
ncbi:DUF938 domain-containing protein [Synechococcus sp. A15-28]|jgi:hypothetical protein|uniref:DUF938 domain-containing protein n=1 Tax=Synechococcus sp. A15-28 TaxID=1050638 RepID=UPI001645B268|nr:DUF938 domain-containing protein [Synechococcus sp. A15-28]QNI41874.1 hypothetical protein SynA1528_00836 [Synechococcus sp. A15-28]|tara:strand:- start:441 stop:1058 length:618 start_codon:yes stop_codon:yes gene_type:complete